MQKIERQLGVKLTGSEELIGTPLQPKGQKGAAKGESSKTGGDSSKGKGK